MLDNMAWEGSPPQAGGARLNELKAGGLIGKGAELEVMNGGIVPYPAGPYGGKELLELDCGIYP